MSDAAAPALTDVEASWPVQRSVDRFSGKVISVRTDSVGMPGDSVADRDVVVHPGSVAVIAVDEALRVLVIQQYRHPVGRLLWEPPAGLLDEPGEDPLQAAKRELFEEAHHRAADWRVLLDAFTSPGMSDEAIRIYLARDLTEVGSADRFVGAHEETDMPVAWVEPHTLVDRALAGRLHNPQLLLGALALQAVLAGSGVEALRPGDAPWPERDSR